MLGGFTIETTKSTHKAFRLFGFTCAGVSVFYISIQTVQAILRRVRPAPPRRQEKGDGQEAQEAQEKEVTQGNLEDGDGEGGKLLAADDAEMSMIVRARESPIGGVEAEIE